MDKVEKYLKGILTEMKITNRELKKINRRESQAQVSVAISDEELNKMKREVSI